MSERRSLSPLFTWRSAICDAELSAVAKHIGLTLSLHMNERGASCFPSVERLGRESSRSRNTVRCGLAELEGTGWLVVDRPKNQHRGQVTNYRAVIPAWALQRILDEGADDLSQLVDNLSGRGEQMTPSIDGRGQSQREKGSATDPEVVTDEDVKERPAVANSAVDKDGPEPWGFDRSEIDKARAQIRRPA